MTRAKDISKIITAPAFGGLTYPTSDGSNGQVIQTNGNGTLSFTTITGTTINNNADNRIITGSGSSNTLEAEANLTFDGSTLDLGDNIQARFGASQDMQIFHDGSDSKIVESGTGNLILQSDGTEVQIMNASEFMGRFQNNGAVKLFHDNSKKFETTSGGITVTGTVSATNLNLTTGDINVTGTGNRAISVLSDDGLGTMEIGGATGGFLDIKQPKTDDFDIRLGSSGSGGYLTIASGSFTVSGGVLNSVSGFQSNGVVLPFQSTPVEASTGSSISVGTSYTTVTSVAISHDSNDTVLIFASFQLDTQSSSTSGQGDFRILATNTSQSAELNVNTILAESARLRWQQAYIAQDLRGITAVTTYHIQVRKSNGSMTINGGGGTSRLLLIKKTA